MNHTSLPQDFVALALASQSLGERSDCAVKAVAFVCGVIYKDAHAACKRFGRKDRKGTYMATTQQAVNSFGKRMVRMDPKSFIAQYPGHHKGCKSVTTHHPRRFPGVFPKNKVYLFRTQGHILAVVGGEVKDWTINKSLKVIDIWEVI